MASNTLVFDGGSGLFKAGFAGEDSPRSIFTNCVGKGTGGKDDGRPIGKEACLEGQNVTYPIQHGIVKNWDELECIWRHAFYNELGVQPEDSSVLLTDAILNPKANREKAAEIMFETFNILALFMQSQPVLSLLASGRESGIVLEIGDGVSQIAPICQGYALPQALQRLTLGGREITAWLQKMLEEQGRTFATWAERDMVRDIKEKLGYVALDYSEEVRKAEVSSELNRSYPLPGGGELTIGSQRFRCAELLFRPGLNGFDYDGIDRTLFDSITRCDINVRRDLFANIVLTGGSSMFPGLPQRLEKEIVALAPPGVNVKVVAPEERKFAAWVGGSIFASLDGFSDMVITCDEYIDSGPAIVQRKFP